MVPRKKTLAKTAEKKSVSTKEKKVPSVVEKKETAIAEVAKKETAVAAVAKKKETDVTVKKTTAKRTTKTTTKTTTAAKKTAEKKEVKTVAYVQYAGAEISIEKLEAEAKKAYAALGHKEEEIETLTLYVKPEERAVYYVVNGEGSSEYKIVY